MKFPNFAGRVGAVPPPKSEICNQRPQSRTPEVEPLSITALESVVLNDVTNDQVFKVSKVWKDYR